MGEAVQGGTGLTGHRGTSFQKRRPEEQGRQDPSRVNKSPGKDRVFLSA